MTHQQTGRRKLTEAAETLSAARKLIENPENWLQNRLQEGKACCALGALRRVTKEKPGWMECVTLLQSEMGGFIMSFNDTHTHAEVLAAFDRAITEAGRTALAGNGAGQ